MVLIAEGKFLMGISEDKISLDKDVGISVDAFPANKIYLKDFLIVSLSEIHF
jgi:hypothetical protein